MPRGSVKVEGAVILVDRSIARRLFDRLGSQRSEIRGSDEPLWDFLRQLGEFGYADVPLSRTSSDLAAASKKYIYTADEAARRLRIGAHQVTKLCRSGRLAGELIGGRWLIPTTALDDYRASRR